MIIRNRPELSPVSYITDRPDLSPEEKKLGYSKYYDLLLTPPEPLRQQLIDKCPIDPKKAIKPENFLDHLIIDGYAEEEYLKKVIIHATVEA